GPLPAVRHRQPVAHPARADERRDGARGRGRVAARPDRAGPACAAARRTTGDGRARRRLRTVTESRPHMDWWAWHRDYDAPASPVSRRLVEVRSRLATALDAVPGRVRLLNLCAGDARDTVPVLATTDREVEACAVELDPALAEEARRTALDAGVGLDVRTGDAADPATYADRLPVDV